MRKLGIVAAALFSFLIFTLIGCFDVPEEVILPEWDVELNVPIIDRTYSLYDMFKPESKYAITSEVGSDEFYLIKTDNFTSKKNVGKQIRFQDSESNSQNVVVPANAPATPIFLEFPDQLEVESATFKSGMLAFSINNPTAAPINSSLHVPGIRKPDGSELIITSTVAAFGTDSIFYDISNHSYTLPVNQPAQTKNSLQLVASANSPINGSYEQVDFYLTDLNFKSITGSIPRVSMSDETTSTSLNINDAADYRGKLFIKEGNLNLTAEYISAHQNGFEIGISKLKIIGRSSSGNEIELHRNDGQEISFTIQNGMQSINLDDKNSNLTDFLSTLPDSVFIMSEIVVNPDNKHDIRSLTDEDSIRFSFNFSTRSVFAMRQTHFIDTLDLNMSQDDRDNLQDGISANLNFYIENAIPIDAYIKLTVTDEFFNPLFVITRNQNGTDSMQILGGEVDNYTGAVISPSVTNNSIELSSEQIGKLALAYHVILSSTVNTKNAANLPEPPSVQFKSSDWIKIKSFGKIKYHVNGEGN